MTRDNLTQKLQALVNWERRWFWGIIAAFVVPVSIFLLVYKQMDAIPRTRLALGGISCTAWFLTVFALLLLHPRKIRRLGLRCTACQAPLCGTNSASVLSTTRCAGCGQKVIDENEGPVESVRSS